MSVTNIGVGTIVRDLHGREHLVKGVQSLTCDSQLVDIDSMVWEHRILVTFLIEKKQAGGKRKIGIVTQPPQNGLLTLEYPTTNMLQFGGMVAEPIVESFAIESPPHIMERVKIMIHPSGMVYYGWVGREKLEAAYKMALARQGVLYD